MTGPDFSSWPRRPLPSGGREYLSPSPRPRILLSLVLPILAGLDLFLLGAKVEGRENLRALGKGGVVGICNHIHHLDCTLMARSLPRRRQNFLTLQSNLEMRLIGPLVSALGGVPIPTDHRQLPAFSSALREALAAGGVIHLYPEGELEPYCPTLRPFKNTAFSLAYDAQVPILPMCIVLREPRGLFRLYKRKPCMTLHILPPLFPDPSAPRAAEALRLKAACRAAMEDCLLLKARDAQR